MQTGTVHYQGDGGKDGTHKENARLYQPVSHCHYEMRKKTELGNRRGPKGAELAPAGPASNHGGANGEEETRTGSGGHLPLPPCR